MTFCANVATAKPKHLLKHLRRAWKVAPNADTPQRCD
jgi:hypothetical protein